MALLDQILQIKDLTRLTEAQGAVLEKVIFREIAANKDLMKHLETTVAKTVEMLPRH